MAAAKRNNRVSRKKESELVTVDFIELDMIRRTVRHWVKRYWKEYPRYKHAGGVWKNSTFYIGRGVTNLCLHSLNLPIVGVRKLVKEMRLIYPEYKIMQSGLTLTSIRVYMRGKGRK